MTETEAIVQLILLDKERIETIDGEWGCSHSYADALANTHDWGNGPEPVMCMMHEDAVLLEEMILTLSPEVRAALPGTDKENN